jgi:uncharacterized protein (TIGR02246 family)
VKRIALAALTILATLALCFGQAVRPGSPKAVGDEEAVRKFFDDASAAFSRNDAAALESLMTPDYIFVNQNGVVQSRAQRLAGLKTGNLKYESVKYSEVAVHLYGDAAAATALVDVKGTNRGADISGQFRSTVMLVKVKGRWLMAASQANVIAQQQ